MQLKPGLTHDRIFVRHSTADGILTVFVSGPVTSEFLIQYAENHLDLWADQSSILWDLRDMIFIHFDVQTYWSVPEVFSKVHAARKTGKTALLLDSEDFQLGELLVEFTELYKSPIKHSVFTSIAKAKNWLNSE